MASEILPPSPNWYLSSASSVSEDGIFAFATKSTVYLLDITVSPPVFSGSLCGHNDRVTAVSCCRSTGATHLCATAGDDAVIKIWDLRSKIPLHEKRYYDNKITSLDWSRASKDIVVAGDEKGFLIYWNIDSGDVKLLKPDKGSIYSLACSPHDANVVAVGYKEGKILLVNALSKKDQVLHSLRGHNDEVQSVAWAPYQGEGAFLKKRPEDEGADAPADQGCLLISGSRDKTLRVWSSGRGKLLKVLNLPPRGGGQRPRDRGDEPGMKSKVWIGLRWSRERPHQVVSSSHGGDVILWDLSRAGQPRWEILGADGDVSHMRSVFSVVGRSADPDRVITTSMDRQVICWNLATLKAEWSLPSLGGFVYCIAPSPLDPTRLAIGVGDNMIRVWNTVAHGRMYDVVALWQGIRSKVTVVCWHPLRENSLAYGTDDGRVGIFNVASQAKPPQISWTYHKKTVYSLSWGPPCPKPEGQQSCSHFLYSCGGEGMVFEHNPAKLDQEATNVNSVIKITNGLQHLMPQRSDIAWRMDGRAVAIGNEDGSIEVFTPPDLRMLCAIHVQTKIINCLQWYPEWELTDHPDSDRLNQDWTSGSQRQHPTSDERTEPIAAEKQSGDEHTEEAVGITSAEAHTQIDSQSEETINGQPEQATNSQSEEACNGQSHEASNGQSQEAINGQSQEAINDQSQEAVYDCKKRDSGLRKLASDQSVKRYWLASGCNDHDVEIYDLGTFFKDNSAETHSAPMTSSFRTLSGHSARVTSLAWSPHGDGRLVSTSYDHSAQVWDVPRGEPVANFRGHSGRVFSCHVSCSDPDVVLTGGEDFCLMKWRVSETRDIRPPKTTRKYAGNRKSGRKGKKASQQTAQEAANDSATMATRNLERNGEAKEARDDGQLCEGNGQDTVSTDLTTPESEQIPSSYEDQKKEDRVEGVEDERTALERKKRELLAQVEEMEGRMRREEDGLERTVEEEEAKENQAAETRAAVDAILDRIGYGRREASSSGPMRDAGQERGTVRDMTQPSVRKGKSKRFKSLFPLSGGQDNRGKTFLQQDCIELAKIKQSQLDSDSGTSLNLDQTGLHLGLFANRKMTMKMLNEEAVQHAASGNFDQHCQLNLWKGNILHPLREAIRKGQLTDWLVSMAPLAGHDVWLKTCEAFARQLESQGHFHRAVTYYLLSQQVYGAIAMLKKNNMLRDAITLAQVRLLPSDPVLHDLYMTWAEQLENANSYEPAARCYLATNQTLNAVKVLARKGDAAALGTALQVGMATDLTDNAFVNAVATRFLNLSLATGEWKQAFEILSLHKKYEIYAQLVLVYELLVWCLVHQGYLAPSHDIDHTDVHHAIISSVQWKESCVGSYSWPTPSTDGVPLINAAFERARLSCDQPHDQQSLGDLLTPSDIQSGDINKILKLAAQYLMLGQCCQRSGQHAGMMGCLVDALRSCHLTGYPTVAMVMLQLAIPQGYESLDEMESKMKTSKSPDDIMACLRAYYKLTQLYRVRESLVSDSCKSNSTLENPEQGTDKDPDQASHAIRQGDSETPGAHEVCHPCRTDATMTGQDERSDGDDTALISNPRAGYLFSGQALQRTPAWPVQPSIDLIQRALPISTEGEKGVESLDPSPCATCSKSDDEPGKPLEELVTQILALRSGTSCNISQGTGTALESFNELAKDRVKESGNQHAENSQGEMTAEGSSIAMATGSAEVAGDPRQKGGSEDRLQESSVDSAGEALTRDESHWQELSKISRVLLNGHHPHLCVASSKLSRLVQSSEDDDAHRDSRLDPGDSSWRTLVDGLALATPETLAELVCREDVGVVLHTLNSRLQREVKRFPDPFSSCAALLDTLLILRSQSPDYPSDQLQRELCEWFQRYCPGEQ